MQGTAGGCFTEIWERLRDPPPRRNATNATEEHSTKSCTHCTHFRLDTLQCIEEMRGRATGAYLTLLMALPLWNQRLGTRFGPRFLTRCGRTGYSGRILMALGKHDVLPVRWELMNRFFAVIYFPLVSYFHQTSADGLSTVKAWSLFQTGEFVFIELNSVCNLSPIGPLACDKFSLQ